MEIFQVVGLSIVAVVLLTLLRRQRPELAVQVSIVVGVIIFLAVAARLASLLDVLYDMAQRAQVNTLYLTTVLRIIGVAYAAEFGAQVCRDADEGAVAAKVELAGKVTILVLAVPILIAIMDTLLRLLV
ncbi:MAG: stage III sporulation protein AD [Bacillota bacterium]